MKISRIEPQKKNKNRCSLYVDGEFRLGLSNELVLKYNLAQGDEISEAEIQDILVQEEKTKIKNRAFKILHYRDRSVSELSDRLISLGFDRRLVTEVIDEFIEDSTLNDKRFAGEFISDYTKLNLKGNKYIYKELLKKGISKTVINDLLDSRDERALVKRFIKEKLKGFNTGDMKDRQKMIRRLLSRGFTSSLVYDILNKECQ